MLIEFIVTHILILLLEKQKYPVDEYKRCR